MDPKPKGGSLGKSESSCAVGEFEVESRVAGTVMAIGLDAA